MKILNFGSCNIDYVYSVDHIVLPGETITSGRMEIFPGGKGLNQSIAISRAGSKIYHAGCIGADGEWLCSLLKDNGADVSRLKKTEEKNGHAIIQVSETGENSIFLYPGSNRMLTEEYVESVLDGFGSGDILVLQNETNLIDYIICQAHTRKMKILLNPAPFTKDLKQIDLSMISYLVLNEIEAACFTGIDDPKESIEYLLKKYPELCVILTLGKQGALYSDQMQTIYQPAFCVSTVDTTAAGDTFTGYFIAMIAQGKDERKALQLASAASALAVSSMGAATSIPEKSAVLSSLSELSPYDSNIENNEHKIHKTILHYLKENLCDANLTDLSKELGYSPVYTGELVKKVSGETFSDLLLKKRCEEAARLLIKTELSIGEIISRVGYKNESFFRKAFKHFYGENPLSYRKNIYRRS